MPEGPEEAPDPLVGGAASSGELRGLADKARLDVEDREHQLALAQSVFPSPKTANWIGWLHRTLHQQRETLHARQVAAHAADPAYEITAKSPDELKAEYARNGEMMKQLRSRPEHERRYFLGRTLGQIRRDPLYRAVVRRGAPRPAATHQRWREHRPAAIRRAASSSATSGSDPGGDDPPLEPAVRYVGGGWMV